MFTLLASGLKFSICSNRRATDKKSFVRAGQMSCELQGQMGGDSTGGRGPQGTDGDMEMCSQVCHNIRRQI